MSVCAGQAYECEFCNQKFKSDSADSNVTNVPMVTTKRASSWFI